MDRSKWEYKKLGDICKSINAGGTPSRGNSAYWNGDIPWVKIRDMNSKYVNSTEEFITEEGLNNSSAKLFEPGTILYSIFATIGAASILEIPATTNQAIAGIVLGDGCDRDFYYYYLTSLKTHFENISKGVAQNNINLSVLRNQKVVVPPISDQQRIVAELDCLNKMIAVKQEQLKEFDKLAQSIFYDMFGDPVLNEKRWEIRPLGELISIMGGFAFKSSSYVDIGIRLVQIANVWEDNIKWDEITHVPKEDVNKRPDYLLKPGDIVMALTRPIIKSLGSVKIARIRNCDIPCALNQRVCKFAFSNSLLSPHWFYHFARTDYFKDMINSFSSKGMQPNVSTKEIESILTPYIPLSLQQQFADKISAIEAQKELVKQSIAETQALLDYTMDKYFG